jgi:hypothetical protein
MFKVVMSLLLLRNVVKRKNVLLEDYSKSFDPSKMIIDLFEIRYLPVEFDRVYSQEGNEDE